MREAGVRRQDTAPSSKLACSLLGRLLAHGLQQRLEISYRAVAHYQTAAVDDRHVRQATDCVRRVRIDGDKALRVLDARLLHKLLLLHVITATHCDTEAHQGRVCQGSSQARTSSPPPTVLTIATLSGVFALAYFFTSGSTFLTLAWQASQC